MSLATDLQLMIHDSFFGGAKSVTFTAPAGTTTSADCLIGDASDADELQLAGLDAARGIEIYGDRADFTTLPGPGWLATIDAVVYRLITVRKTPEGSGVVFICEEQTA